MVDFLKAADGVFTVPAITLQHALINEETCYGETNGANNGCTVFGNTDGVELINQRDEFRDKTARLTNEVNGLKGKVGGQL